MLNSIIELNQKELSLIGGGEDTLTTASGNTTATDIDGNNVPAQPSSLGSFLEAVPGYAWSVAQGAMVTAALAIGLLIGVTGTCYMKRRLSLGSPKK
jgi:hypothetical protein